MRSFKALLRCLFKGHDWAYSRRTEGHMTCRRCKKRRKITAYFP